MPSISGFGLAATNGLGEASGVCEGGDGTEIGIMIATNYYQPQHHKEPPNKIKQNVKSITKL